MEDRTLKTEAEVIELVQSSLNNVETENSCNTGASARHGAHQDAQTFTTVT